MKVRITEIDGKLPNLALMRISAYHKENGDEVYFHRNAEPDLLEPEYDRVYGSSIFKFSEKKLARFKTAYPDAILGGTGTFSTLQVEDLCPGPERYDYEIYPEFKASIGFTARGCRLKCGFCVVPKKEGKPRSVSTIYDIWRGDPYPRNIHLLDNDFFGQPEDQWRARIQEIREGGFGACFNQGINIRLVNEEIAEALASIRCYDDQFKVKRLYCAWDNKRDYQVFMRGVDFLEKAGFNPKYLLAYMLIGYDKRETMEDILWRFDRMRERNIFVFPMVFDRSRKDLRDFARWAIRGIHNVCSFEEYRSGIRKRDSRERDFFSDDDDLEAAE
jgi:hypothetical protein